VSTVQNNNGNPNWKTLLDKIPNELHSIVTPILQEWDQGVNNRFEAIHEQYKPLKGYESLAQNGIAPDYAYAAAQLADQMQRNPQLIAKQMSETYGLNLMTPEEAQQKFSQQSAGGSTDGQDDPFSDPTTDIFKDPRIQKLAQGFEQLQSQLTEQQQREQLQQQADQWEDYLDQLQEQATRDNLPEFDREYVTAIASQGVSGEEAVKRYYKALAISSVGGNENQQPGQHQQPPPNVPPVMGGAGNAGVGLGDGSIDFGAMPAKDLNNTVAELLRQANESGQ
jgi:Tfp pilus assembly protein PilN